MNSSGKNFRRVLSDRSGKKRQSEYASPKNTFFFGVVKNIDDDLGSRRVKARIDGVDDSTPTSQENTLEWCIPLMPPFFHCLPKVGETIIIFLRNPWNGSLGRYYFGPIMSRDATDEQPYDEMIDGFDLNRKNK